MEVILDSPESSTRHFSYASIGSRLIASIIDSVLIGVLQGLFSILVTGSMFNTTFNPLITFTGLGVGFLYETLMTSGKNMGTLGKMAMRIRISNMEGNRISYAQAVGRYFSKFLSAIILGIGYIMAFFSSKNQALHDQLAKTLVIS